MSVLIRGMEMPKICGECKFFAWKQGVGNHCAIDDRITFHATLDGLDVRYEKSGNCPLVEVPPHGDLIDRDALTERLDGIWDCNDMVFEDDNVCERIHTDCNSCRWRETRDYITDHVIKHAPTIIEAAEGE